MILGLISEFASVVIAVWELFFGYYKRLEKSGETTKQQERKDKIKGSLVLIFLIIGLGLQGAAVFY